jgi:hypothetical protein
MNKSPNIDSSNWTIYLNMSKRKHPDESMSTAGFSTIPKVDVVHEITKHEQQLQLLFDEYKNKPAPDGLTNTDECQMYVEKIDSMIDITKELRKAQDDYRNNVKKVRQNMCKHQFKWVIEMEVWYDHCVLCDLFKFH